MSRHPRRGYQNLSGFYGIQSDFVVFDVAIPINYMAPNRGEDAKSKKDDLDVVEPLPSDILLGRGKHAEDQEGNIYFRSVIQRWAVAYQETDRTMVRKDIALKAMAEIEAEGCRFLQLQKIRTLKELSESSQHWVIIPRKAALSKVKQALRDGTRQLPASRRAVSSIRSLWSSFGVRNQSLKEPPTALAGNDLQSLVPPSRWSSSATMGHNADHFTVGIGRNPILAPDGTSADAAHESLRRLPMRHDKSDPQGLDPESSSRWRSTITIANDRSMQIPVATRASVGMHAQFNSAAVAPHIGHIRDPRQFDREVTVNEAERDQRHAPHIRPKMSQEVTEIDEKDALLSPVDGDLQENWFAFAATPPTSPELQQRYSPSFLDDLFEDED